MNRASNLEGSAGSNGDGRRRSYSSRLRAEQAAATRARILDGLTRTMARGLADVSVPAVAREADVSVKTIYRHFGSKRVLFAELGPYVARKAGLMPTDEEYTLDDVPNIVRAMFRRTESMDATIRAAMASQLGQEMRIQMMPERLDMVRRAIRRSAAELPDHELEQFARVLLLLFSSAMQRAFKDYLGAGADEAANTVTWATRMLLRGVRAGEKEAADDER